MGLKQGYKQTEIGLIPEDWELKSMKEVCWVNQGLQIPIEKRKKRPSIKSKVYLTIQFINGGKEIEYIDDYAQSVCCNKEDVLMTRTGNTGIVVSDVEGVFHNNFFKINFDKTQIYRDFLLSFLRDNKTQKRILEKAGTSTIPDLNHNDFYSIEIIKPPLLEQKAIAQVVSDTDNLIQAIEKKLAKKRAIKQGAMQQLLKPKEDWGVKTILSITRNIIDYRGVTPRKKGMEWGNGNIVALSAGNVKRGCIDFEAECYLGSEELYKKWMVNGDTKKDDIVFTMEAPLGNVALIPDDKKYILSQRTILLQIDRDNFDSNFIFQQLLSSQFQNYILKSSTGSTAKGIKRKTFEKLLLGFPSLKKQKEIATILSDMDVEIAQLEQKLSKYKQIKQGLMQNLLTGKIRLLETTKNNRG